VGVGNGLSGHLLESSLLNVLVESVVRIGSEPTLLFDSTHSRERL